MSIQTNIATANAARSELRKHCMAFRVIESKDHLTVVFPVGYRIDGVRVSMANGIVWACQKATEKMERVWKGGI